MNAARRAFGGLAIAALLLLGACGGGGTASQPESSPAATVTPEVLTITTASAVQAVVNVPFTATLQVQGALSAVTWSITSGQLPAGLSLNASTGVVSGTPTSGLGSSATIRAADSAASASKAFSFQLFTQLSITPVTPPPGHLGSPYSLALAAGGSGSAIASWSVASGSLPPGLALAKNQSNTNATISGVPAQVGSFTFTIQAQDFTLPQTAGVTLTIVIDSHLAISKTSLKNGGQNQVYSDSFAAVNGTLPYRWTISGNFPAGLSIDPATGQVTGTPTNSGSFAYTVSVADSSAAPQSDSATGTLNVAAQLQTSGTFPHAFIGISYSAAVSATGGATPYIWSVIAGALPPGFVLSSSGTLAGNPTQAGTYNFTLQVTDSGSPPYVVTLPVIFPVSPQPLLITGTPLSPAPVNVIYHSQIGLRGGTPPYSWAISSGQLPAGLALDSSTGSIDGTPTQAGTVNFTATGTDSGNPQQTASANEFIQIRGALGRNDSIATATPLGNILNPPLPLFLSLSPYIDPIGAATPNPDTDFYRLVATGGSAVHVQTSAAWPLDTVIELLGAGGQRLQTCTQPAYSSPCLNDDIDSTTMNSALDLQTPGSSNAQTTFYLHVFDWRGDARPDMRYSLSISGVIEPLTISPASIGGGTRGVNYQQQFTAAGGAGTATWSIAGGALPPGWSLSSAGLLSGPSSADGFYTFAVQAADAANPPQVATAQYSVQIAEPVAITSSGTLPNACANQPYSFAVQTSGGVPPLHFSFTSSNWTGINPNTATGVFSGTPSVPGAFTGSLGVTDSAQPPSAQSQQITLTVVTCP